MKAVLALALALLPCLSPGLVAGDGSVPLLSPPALSLDFNFQQMTLADLDGDGVPDLVASGVLSTPTVSALGQADGSFVPVDIIPGNLAVQPPVLRDLTGDGVPDLLGSFADGKRVDLIPGLGDGTFGVATTLYQVFIRALVAVGDVEGDGDPDVYIWALGTPIGQHEGLLHLINDGAGNFTPQPALASTVQARYLVVRDLEGDGDPDVVVFEDFPLNRLLVFLSHGDGSYAAPQVLADFGLSGSRRLLAEDLDADGDLDLLLASFAEDELRQYLNPGNGVFPGPQIHDLPTGTVELISLDRQGDGVPELAVSDSADGSLWLLEGPGFASWNRALDGLTTPRLRAAGDLDGDGRVELLVHSGFTEPRLHVVHDLSYPADGPFTNLGLGGVEGADAGTPILVLEGAPQAEQELALDALHTPAGTPTWFVVGVSTLELPFKTGLMVPTLSLLLGPFPSDANGEARVATIWPAGLTGFPLWVQAWGQDGSGPAGLPASPAARLDVP